MSVHESDDVITVVAHDGRKELPVLHADNYRRDCLIEFIHNGYLNTAIARFNCHEKAWIAQSSIHPEIIQENNVLRWVYVDEIFSDAIRKRWIEEGEWIQESHRGIQPLNQEG